MQITRSIFIIFIPVNIPGISLFGYSLVNNNEQKTLHLLNYHPIPEVIVEPSEKYSESTSYSLTWSRYRLHNYIKCHELAWCPNLKNKTKSNYIFADLKSHWLFDASIIHRLALWLRRERKEDKEGLLSSQSLIGCCRTQGRHRSSWEEGRYGVKKSVFSQFCTLDSILYWSSTGFGVIGEDSFCWRLILILQLEPSGVNV